MFQDVSPLPTTNNNTSNDTPKTLTSSAYLNSRLPSTSTTETKYVSKFFPLPQYYIFR
jgi:hypothetical protein